MALIGYARADTFEQTLDRKRRELRAAGCDSIHEGHASGADRRRPALARLLATIIPGDTLIVVRLDRLARSLVHLLQVIDLLKAKGVHFRSLGDPIDTTTPQATFSLQVMGAEVDCHYAGAVAVPEWLTAICSPCSTSRPTLRRGALPSRARHLNARSSSLQVLP